MQISQELLIGFPQKFESFSRTTHPILKKIAGAHLQIYYYNMAKLQKNPPDSFGGVPRTKTYSKYWKISQKIENFSRTTHPILTEIAGAHLQI